jgi:lysophospholipase L1-like esterase
VRVAKACILALACAALGACGAEPGAGGGGTDASAGGAGGTPAAGGAGGAGGGGGEGGGAGGSGGVPAAGGAGGRGGAGGAGGAAGAGGTGGGQAGAGGAGGAGAAAGSGGAGGAGGAQAAIRVWIAGDSTVATSSGNPCPIGWGGQIASLFDDHVTVTNSAVAGRSVRTWLYDVQTVMDATGECVLTLDTSGQPVLQARWQAMLNAMTGMKPGDYLFIQFGINDSDPMCDRHVGLDAFKMSYGMMAQAAKDRGANPVFVTPVSGISCSGSTARDSRGAYVPATKEAGTQYGVPVIDLDAASVALYNSLRFCPVPGGDVSASTTGPVGDFFCDDHTHFSQAGAAQIAGLVAQAIRAQNLPLAAHLR